MEFICLAILPNGITVWWDGISRVYINVPGRFQNSFKVERLFIKIFGYSFFSGSLWDIFWKSI